MMRVGKYKDRCVGRALETNLKRKGRGRAEPMGSCNGGVCGCRKPRPRVGTIVPSREIGHRVVLDASAILF